MTTTEAGPRERFSDELKLFVLSTIALYFELLVVRWTNAYVKNVGFFTNFLVLASFVGLGGGLLLAKRKAFLLPLFPLLLLTYCGLVHVARPQLQLVDSGALFWGEYTKPEGEETFAIAPEHFVSIAFVMVSLMFVLIGHETGKLFAKLHSLRGYACNIAGSLLGVVLYTANSYVLAKPVVWFGLVLLGIAPFLWKKRSAAIVGYIVSAGILGFVSWLDVGSEWSPYYRTEHACLPSGDCSLAGNGIWGMQLVRFMPGPTIYNVIHGERGLVKAKHYSDVLVVGAGGGNDVDVALHFGADHIDAVEINPMVLELGKRLHPDKPYLSDKVTLHLDDGRAFLRTTEKKYDLAIYALPDSTGFVSSHANMRMESYLFTVEAFRAVRAHLKENGVFALYNHYREQWLVDKIAGMLREAFDEPPVVFSDRNATAVLIAGPGVHEISKVPSPPRPPSAHRPATDDWPFLYLKAASIPSIYRRALAVIATLSFALIALFAWLSTRNETDPALRSFRLDAPMFFMGAAFMLLEAKSIVTFGLLFGTTWLTTAMVIGGILVMVLLAIFATQKLALERLWPWGIALAGALVLVYVVPPEKFVFTSPVLRYVVGAAAALSPVAFANVIFAKLLGETKETTRSLASNLIGSVFGGIGEYLSLATGYRALLPIVAGLYGAAFLVVFFRHRSASATASSSNA